LKKDKTPAILKFIRWIFPKLELIAPFIAQKLFIKIFFSPFRYQVPPKEKELQQQAQWFTVHVSEKKIQCYSWGEGPVVLLVHGWAGRASQFRKIIEALVQAGYKVVGFDGPAHGNSQGNSTTIIEFEEAFKKIYLVTGEPKAIITHSFGGSAILYAASQGLPVKKLINIASPTIGDEIINTYLRTINGSLKIGNFFKEYMIKTFGKEFNEFSALHSIKNMQQTIDLLLIYDDNDKEVTVQHALELIKVYPRARLYRTHGLGHTRILKDDDVIQQCVTFITAPRLTA
jgi:esterase/lipase